MNKKRKNSHHQRSNGGQQEDMGQQPSERLKQNGEKQLTDSVHIGLGNNVQIITNTAYGSEGFGFVSPQGIVEHDVDNNNGSPPSNIESNTIFMGGDVTKEPSPDLLGSRSFDNDGHFLAKSNQGSIQKVKQNQSKNQRFIPNRLVDETSILMGEELNQHNGQSVSLESNESSGSENYRQKPTKNEIEQLASKLPLKNVANVQHLGKSEDVVSADKEKDESLAERADDSEDIVSAEKEKDESLAEKADDGENVVSADKEQDESNENGKNDDNTEKADDDNGGNEENDGGAIDDTNGSAVMEDDNDDEDANNVDNDGLAKLGETNNGENERDDGDGSDNNEDNTEDTAEDNENTVNNSGNKHGTFTRIGTQKHVNPVSKCQVNHLTSGNAKKLLMQFAKCLQSENSGRRNKDKYTDMTGHENFAENNDAVDPPRASPHRSPIFLPFISKNIFEREEGKLVPQDMPLHYPFAWSPSSMERMFRSRPYGYRYLDEHPLMSSHITPNEENDMVQPVQHADQEVAMMQRIFGQYDHNIYRSLHQFE